MSDINWDEAPEGATHYDTRPDVYPWLKEDDNGNKYWHFDRWVTYINDIGVNESIFAKPVTLSPVYTQEMADNGMLPSVGMVVLDKRNNNEYEILLPADNNGYYVMIGGDGGYHCELLKYLKPTTPPIKLVDGKAYQFDVRDKGGIVCGIYSKWDDKMHVGPSHYFDLLSATNIKLLEVK